MVLDWLRAAGYDRPRAVRRVLTPRVSSHLLAEERVLVSTRRHPLVAVWPMPVSLAYLVLVAALTGQLPVGNPIIDILWWSWFATVGYAGWRLVEWNNDIFVVTDRRVMLFTGFITRRVAMMPLVKVTDLTYQRTPIGQLLRYGDFIIESAGQDQALHKIPFLPSPSELYQQVATTLFGRGPSPIPSPQALLRHREAASTPPPQSAAPAYVVPSPVPEPEERRSWRPAWSQERLADTGELDRVED